MLWFFVVSLDPVQAVTEKIDYERPLPSVYMVVLRYPHPFFLQSSIKRKRTH